MVNTMAGQAELRAVSFCEFFVLFHSMSRRFSNFIVICRLCSPGWKVCEAADKHMLGLITWEHATGLTGCYAFNAAQDGGQCRPCINHVEQVSHSLNDVIRIKSPS